MANKSTSEPDQGIRDAYNLLVVQVQQLEDAKRTINEKIEKALAARNLLGQLLDSEEAGTDDATSVARGGKKKTGRRRGPHKNSKTAAVLSRAKSILLDTGRPLGRSELVAAIAASGLQISTTDPARFIGRALWRSSEFIHVPKEGYWLADLAEHPTAKASKQS